MTTTSEPEQPTGALARINPEDDPDATMVALTGVGAPAKPGTALVAARSSGMQHLDELMRYATIFANAGVFKGLTSGDVKRQAALCAVKVIAGDELGIPPMAAMRSIHVFDGRVELSGALIMSLINRYQARPAPSGIHYKARVRERTTEACTIAFFSREHIADEWEHLEDVRFTIQDAQRAKLTSKDNWQAYPRAMLFNRCASEGARVHAAECFGGAPVYGAGEISNAQVDADGNFAAGMFERATDNAAASVMEFDDEIVSLAKRAGWTQSMLEAQATRLGDRSRLLATLTKVVERTENSARGRSRSGQVQPTQSAPTAEPDEPMQATNFEDAPPNDAPGSITSETRGKLFGALGRRNITEKPARIAWARAHELDINPRKGAPNKDPSFANLSQADALKGLDLLTVTAGEERRDRVLLNLCAACGETNGHAHDKDCPIDETDEEIA